MVEKFFEFVNFRLVFHAFADDQGNNPTATLEDVNAQLLTLNEAFINHKIQFLVN